MSFFVYIRYSQPIFLQNIVAISICFQWYPMFVERKVGYSWCRQKMTSFRGQASWPKMNSAGGQAYSTGVPPHQISKQSRVTNLSLYKHWWYLCYDTFSVKCIFPLSSVYTGVKTIDTCCRCWPSQFENKENLLLKSHRSLKSPDPHSMRIWTFKLDFAEQIILANNESEAENRVKYLQKTRYKIGLWKRTV